MIDYAALHNLKREHLARLATTRDLANGGARALVNDWMASDILWHGPAPIDDISGADALWNGHWQPLLAAFPDLVNRPDICLTGHWSESDWVVTAGHYIGVFAQDWLGISATGRPVWIRYGQYDRVEAGRVIETFQIIDIPGVMMRAGCWPLAPELGESSRSPAPATQDGLVIGTLDPAAAAASLALVEAMIAGLMSYDGTTLESMGMKRFWTPDFHWYGPAAIGSMRGHADYERGHQWPFLRAFPDRKGGDHKCRIADNQFVASTGWPSVRATHLGGGWLGLAPTGLRVSMRIMDIWRREGDFLAENWVYIDLVDLLRQMGLDVFERMAELRRARGTRRS